jgi:hypothetical protein
VAFSQALCFLDYGAYVDAFDKIQDVQQAAPASQIVRVTFDLLKDRVEDEAKDRLRDRANDALSGLLGRRREPRREETPRPPC